MTTNNLTLIEQFGDAHSRYSTHGGVLIDVVREIDGHWVAYRMEPGAQVGHELEDAPHEERLMKLLERKLQTL